MASPRAMLDLNQAAVRAIALWQEQHGTAAVMADFGLGDTRFRHHGARTEPMLAPMSAHDPRCIMEPVPQIPAILREVERIPQAACATSEAHLALRDLHTRYLDLLLHNWRIGEAHCCVLFGASRELAEHVIVRPGLRKALAQRAQPWLRLRQDILRVEDRGRCAHGARLVRDVLGMDLPYRP